MMKHVLLASLCVLPCLGASTASAITCSFNTNQTGGTGTIQITVGPRGESPQEIVFSLKEPTAFTLHVPAAHFRIRSIVGPSRANAAATTYVIRFRGQAMPNNEYIDQALLKVPYATEVGDRPGSIFLALKDGKEFFGPMTCQEP